MNAHKKFSDACHGRVCVASAALFAVCAAVGALKTAPPLCRLAVRSIALHRARSQWRDILAGGAVAAGAPVCNLRVPAVALDLPVLGGAAAEQLSRLPCLSSVSPDGERSPVIVAHRDRHFRALQGIAEGDRVYLTRRSGESVEYRVLALRVLMPDAAEALARAAQPGTLMLVTCHPFRYIGAAPERFVVLCVRV